MNASIPLAADVRGDVQTARRPYGDEPGAHTSGVSWGSILAGAAAAAALSLILLILGTGLGLSSVSPWSNRGATAATVGVSTILWLTLTQVAAAGMGGYLAGRLRTKWVAVHTDEVYFRDTAHGFLAWAVATLGTAAVLTSAIGSIVNGGVQAGAAMAGGAATAAAAGTAAIGATSKNEIGSMTESADPAGFGMGMSYFVDSLFRKDAGTSSATSTSATPATPASGESMSGASTSEVTRIFANDIRSGSMSAEDSRYVGQLISQRTGIPQADAEKRVNDTFAKVQTKLKDAETAAREAADKARKAAEYTALWLFVSLLIGAFVASLAATFGGRRRDFVYPTTQGRT